MRFSIAALAALAAGAVATTTTDIIYDTTTWCPEEASSTPVVQSSSVQTPIVKATVITHGSQTYSVTKPTSLTMSNGPYTVSRPLLSKTVTYCNKCAGPTAPAGSSPSPSSASVVPVYSGSSVVVPSVPGASQVPGTSASSTPVAPAFTGAASRHIAGAGAGLTAVLGVAAFLL
ncbi:hypothetical protein C8Q69DRAFT_38983 [Paecilomyces variotii]|uniref:GPI anchored protein n=1 Tax=Byssochlamys spectabilis TaxID=264951 RepID=A0A443I742_BYSSP|nr:hypothetical protein C8Q69DRAFT_38983 [Paecilomyces variotii]RWQ99868.1 hypothetical protein C8Q69DRAFT_38983 [Paecilomyces variotii]